MVGSSCFNGGIEVELADNALANSSAFFSIEVTIEPSFAVSWEKDLYLFRASKSAFFGRGAGISKKFLRAKLHLVSHG